jgi:hypothetical protein
MAEVIFNYEEKETIIKCNKDAKMKDIINDYLKQTKKVKKIYIIYIKKMKYMMDLLFLSKQMNLIKLEKE